MTMQIKGKFVLDATIEKAKIANDAIDGSKIKLLAGEALRVVSGLPGGAEKRLIELSNDGEKDIVLVNGKEVATKEYVDDIIGMDATILTSTLTALNTAMKDNDAATGVVNTINSIRLGTGLANDLSYTVPVGSNYLDTSTSLKDADSKLDAAVKGVQDELDDTQTGAGLDTDGSYIQPSGSNYLDTADSLADADSKLDAAVKGVQDELDDTQTGAGLETDGSYVADSTTNYLTAAGSLKDADKKLDAEIKKVANRTFKKEKFALTGAVTEVVLNKKVITHSVVAAVDRLAIHESLDGGTSDDFVVEDTVVGGVTVSKLVFKNSLITPGQESLGAGDTVYVQYMYEAV